MCYCKVFFFFFFKQKTAYEIMPSLVGSEMCIRDKGKGLSYIIQLLNPEVIVLSGPLSKAKQYVLSPIQQSLNRLCLEKISESTPIFISDMGDQSALLGSSEMIFQKVFTEMNFTELYLQEN